MESAGGGGASISKGSPVDPAAPPRPRAAVERTRKCEAEAEAEEEEEEEEEQEEEGVSRWRVIIHPFHRRTIHS